MEDRKQHSGRYTTIKLDPFFQQFLRAHFQNHDPIFSFPKGHDLLMRLEAFLSKPPRDWKPKSYGDWTFRIEIPRMEHKNVDVYNILTETMQRHFERRVREFFRDMIHSHITRMRSRLFTRKEIIDNFMCDYQIDSKYWDRIDREYKRYLSRESTRRFKIKKLKRV